MTVKKNLAVELDKQQWVDWKEVLLMKEFQSDST